MGTIEITDFSTTRASVAEGNYFLKGGHVERVRMVGVSVSSELDSRFAPPKIACVSNNVLRANFISLYCVSDDRSIAWLGTSIGYLLKVSRKRFSTLSRARSFQTLRFKNQF